MDSDLAPNEWPTANFDASGFDGWNALCDAEALGCFDAWCPNGDSW